MEFEMIKDEVLHFFDKKNVLITGGTGLIGRQVVDLLCKVGANCMVISLDKITVHPAVKHIYGDLTDFGFCKEIIKDFDFVFHLAGIKGSIDVTVKKPASHFVPALMFNTNVLEACRLNKVKRVVFTSSIGAYASAEVFREDENQEGSPMDFYAGWAKRMAEFQIRAYKIQYGLDHYSVVRPCNVYGPGDNFDPGNAMVIPTLMYRIYQKEDPVRIWGDGSAVRDFAYSRDVAEGVILALYHSSKGHPFLNLGSGKDYTIKELVQTLHRFLDFNYEFDTNKPSGFAKRVMDISLARKIIDYHPTTSLLDGLKMTWQWFVENQDEYLMKKNYFT
jgi:GDP-L-fucose synthase